MQSSHGFGLYKYISIINIYIYTYNPNQWDDIAYVTISMVFQIHY
jgi:hypothetical protein